MARRRSARRPEPDLDEDMDDDEFAWQSPKKKKKSKKKSATGKKKRSKSATGSTKRSGKTSNKRSSASNKSSGKRASGKLSGSSSRKKSTRSSGRRRRSSEDDDVASSGRRRGRSGRPPIPRKKQGANPVVLISIVTGTILLCLIIVFAMNSGPKKIVEDQPKQLQEADDLAGEAMAAYRKWNKAKSEGNAQAELAAWREAHGKFTKAIDMYNTVLDKYRNPDDDQLPPEYEGYEGALSQMSKHLIDLEKGARTDAMDHGGD